MRREKLLTLLNKESWAAAQTLIDSTEDKDDLLGNMRMGTNNPLILALYRNAPDALVLSIIDGYEDGAFHLNSGGRTPLHCSVYYGSSFAVVERLIKINPAALDARDIMNKTPRDYLPRKALDKTTSALVSKPTAKILKEQRADSSSSPPLLSSKQTLPKHNQQQKPAGQPRLQRADSIEGTLKELKQLFQQQQSQIIALETKQAKDVSLSTSGFRGQFTEPTTLFSDSSKMEPSAKIDADEETPLRQELAGQDKSDSASHRSRFQSFQSWASLLELEELERLVSETKEQLEYLEQLVLEKKIGRQERVDKTDLTDDGI